MFTCEALARKITKGLVSGLFETGLDISCCGFSTGQKTRSAKAVVARPGSKACSDLSMTE